MKTCSIFLIIVSCCISSFSLVFATLEFNHDPAELDLISVYDEEEFLVEKRPDDHGHGDYYHPVDKNIMSTDELTNYYSGRGLADVYQLTGGGNAETIATDAGGGDAATTADKPLHERLKNETDKLVHESHGPPTQAPTPHPSPPGTPGGWGQGLGDRVFQTGGSVKDGNNTKTDKNETHGEKEEEQTRGTVGIFSPSKPHGSGTTATDDSEYHASGSVAHGSGGGGHGDGDVNGTTSSHGGGSHGHGNQGTHGSHLKDPNATDHQYDMFECHNSDSHGHHEPGHACLFPSLILMTGLFVYYILSRYIHALPYTAVMFLIGTAIGISIVHYEDDGHAATSAKMWAGIDSEVLLLVFLPGLIFKDAFGMNVHLFRVGLIQCMNFAFPMVLIGTLATSAVAEHIFPYGWSWDLCMTFGSILSATDPVAVAALLEEVGAPPRLKVHIGGEALLNDGAAIVFFTIFAQRFFSEVEVQGCAEGFGEEIGWARGFQLFFKMAAGGALIGFGFGIILLIILFQLDRRFSHEESIVEVMGTVSAAYLGYYVAEVFMHTSGVIATVACACTVKAYGKASFNDTGLLDGFWSLLEHILNTILFTLGGIEWGVVLAAPDTFMALDWGYLILLYALLTVIRSFNFFLFYPITARIGLKTNLRETIFQIYGGLRGAVGIALALALDNSVRKNAGADSEAAKDTHKLFGFIGGIAFLTLVVNGVTAGPFLIWLGLADSTASRKKLVETCKYGFRKHMTHEFVRLLSQYRFRNVNFGLVRIRVSCLKNLSKAELIEAIEEVKDTTSSRDYQPPFLGGVIPYMAEGASVGDVSQEFSDKVGNLELERGKSARGTPLVSGHSQFQFDTTSSLSLQEMRLLFISMLKASYKDQMENGELSDETLQSIALEKSLEFAQEEVYNGDPLNDWEHVEKFDTQSYGVIRIWKNACTPCFGKAKAGLKVTYKKLRIQRSMNFMAAHESARDFLQKEFVNQKDNPDAAAAAIAVIEESKKQSKKAEDVFKDYSREELENVISLRFCAILLQSGIAYITKLVDQGLLKDDEAEHWVHHVEEELNEALTSTETTKDYPGYIEVDYIEDNNQSEVQTEKSDV